jgi:XRE family transcriptional regulator, master regulator for biofilm formation
MGVSDKRKRGMHMIGRKIEELRKKKGLTLSELAKRSKVSKSYISNIERNVNHNPSIAVIERIAVVLNVDVNCLLNNKTTTATEYMDPEWKEFISELKSAGIKKERIRDYKELIEFISWKEKKRR